MDSYFQQILLQMNEIIIISKYYHLTKLLFNKNIVYKKYYPTVGLPAVHRALIRRAATGLRASL